MLVDDEDVEVAKTGELEERGAGANLSCGRRDDTRRCQQPWSGRGRGRDFEALLEGAGDAERWRGCGGGDDVGGWQSSKSGSWRRRRIRLQRREPSAPTVKGLRPSGRCLSGREPGTFRAHADPAEGMEAVARGAEVKSAVEDLTSIHGITGSRSASAGNVTCAATRSALSLTRKAGQRGRGRRIDRALEDPRRGGGLGAAVRPPSHGMHQSRSRWRWRGERAYPRSLGSGGRAAPTRAGPCIEYPYPHLVLRAVPDIPSPRLLPTIGPVPDPTRPGLAVRKNAQRTMGVAVVAGRSMRVSSPAPRHEARGASSGGIGVGRVARCAAISIRGVACYCTCPQHPRLRRPPRPFAQRRCAIGRRRRRGPTPPPFPLLPPLLFISLPRRSRTKGDGRGLTDAVSSRQHQIYPSP